jgi:O-antigen/teichoic acid export membrane protein
MTIVKKTSVFRARGQFGNIGSLFRKTTLWLAVLGLLYFVVFAGAGAGLGGVKEFFHIQDSALYYILGAIAFISLMVTVVRGILQGLQDFMGLGATMITDAFTRLIFLYVLVSAFSLGARGALATTFVGAAVSFLIGFVLLRGIYGKRGEETEVIRKRDIVFYALPVFLSMLGFALLSYMDVFMVKHFFPSYEAGLYSATSMIGKAFLYFPSAIALTLFPKVSESHELNKDTISLLGKSMALTAVISLGGIVFCFFFPKVIIGLMFGQKFYAIEPVVKIFGAAILPLVLFNVFQNYSLAVHKYAFIYIMYLGIAVYAAALWFFHGTFYQVVAVLFMVNLAILLFGLISLYFDKKVKPVEV